MPLERWNDDRIDDFYEEFRRMVVTVEKVGVIEESLRTVKEDTKACRTNVHALRNDLATAAAAQVTERRSDRRWLIGTCLSSAALIIAAVGVLLGHIG
jgi:hypothetical protein